MKVEALNPFADAAVYVLGEVIPDAQIKRGTLSLREDPHVTSGVSTIIGISGRLRGHVIQDMNRATAIRIASTMNEEELIGLDNTVRATISELANMIAGHATIRLVEAGYLCDITPPAFLIGENSQVFAHKNTKHLIIPLETRCGEITVSIAVEDTKNGR